MVVEADQPGGTMAREYARRAGETEAVAQALYDMECRGPRATRCRRPRRVRCWRSPTGSTCWPTCSASAPSRPAARPVRAASRPPVWSRSCASTRRCRRSPGDRPEGGRRGIGARASTYRRESLEEVAEFAVRRYEQQLIDRGDDHHQVAAVCRWQRLRAVADETLASVGAGRRQRHQPTWSRCCSGYDGSCRRAPRRRTTRAS